MIQNKKRYYTVITFLFLVFTSCKDDDQISIPDVSSIKLDNRIVDFLPNNTGKFDEKIFQKADSTFNTLYFKSILVMDSIQYNLDSINKIFAAPYIKGLNDTIRLEYGDLKSIKSGFSEALKYLKYYVPEYPSPNIYLCNTIMNYQRFLFADADRDGLGIGLDLFLSKYINYKNIDPQNPAFSDYLIRFFDKEHVVSKGMILFCEEIIGDLSGIRLIDKMIHNGKVMYLLEAVMPKENKHTLFDFTVEQMAWCEKNEQSMWSFLNEKNLIYETSPNKINKYVSESPNSPGMPVEAPGKTATYLGWQIVKQWMKRTGSNMNQLIAEKDAQKILDQSNFKPKRS